MNERELTALFRKLGAREPASWARSQIRENLPQLARFLFLRRAWKFVVTVDDPGWIDEALQINPKGPGGAIGPALERLLASGASREDLTSVVRVMQWRLLADLCLLIDDSSIVESEVKDMAWRLFQVDDNGNPLVPIVALHESVLATEPGGKEMRST